MSIARLSRTLRTRLDDERGVALPAVMMFMFAGVLISLVVSSTVLFAFGFSSSTRANVQSQASAEAGIAAARAALLNGDCSSTSGRFVSTTAPIYDVQVYRPSGGGWIEGCPSMSEDARIVATGTAATESINGDADADESEVEAILGSITSEAALAATGPAIFAYSASGAGAGGKLVSLDGENVDVMLHTGHVICDGGFTGAANVVVKSGSFEAQGSCNLNGNVWVNGNISINGGANIAGSVTGNNVTMTNGSVGGNVWADGVLTHQNGTTGGWSSGNSVVIGNGSIGEVWARGGNVTMTGATVRGVLTANGGVTASNGTFQKQVVASGNVSTGISAPQGIVAGGNVTVSNGTTTGVTAGGTLTVTGGSATGTIHVRGLTLNGGGANVGAANVDGAGCFAGNGNVNGAIKVESITVGGVCKAQGSSSWWTGKPITVGSVATPAAPVLSASPGKPAPVTVPNWVDFGSKPGHYTTGSWAGYSVQNLGSNCSVENIWNALQAIGTDPGVIDARGCAINLSSSSEEYTGPFPWGSGDYRNGLRMKNDLVIISNSFDLGGSGRFFADSGSDHQLWLVNPDTIENGVPDCTAGQKLSITGGFKFEHISTMVYSPCKIVIGSSTYLRGQVFAGQTQIAGGATFAYDALGLPGYDLGTGNETAVAPTEWDRPIVSQRNITG